MEVEDEVELAHVGEVVVQDLNEEVDDLEVRELVVVDVDAQGEEEAGVAAVDELVRLVLDEVGEARLADRDKAVDLCLDLLLLVVGVGGVPLLETRLSAVFYLKTN